MRLFRRPVASVDQLRKLSTVLLPGDASAVLERRSQRCASVRRSLPRQRDGRSGIVIGVGIIDDGFTVEDGQTSLEKHVARAAHEQDLVHPVAPLRSGA